MSNRKTNTRHVRMTTTRTPAPTSTEPIKIIEEFLEPEKCQYLIDTYKDRVKRSTVVSPKGDVEDKARTSHTFFLPDDDSVTMELRVKAAKYTGVSPDHIEGLQLVRYSKGEQYKFHYDYFDAIRDNQREHTFLVYLNDLNMEDGGATVFKGYNVKVYPKRGRVIWFRDMTEDGKLNELSLHSGEEVHTDTIKYAVNIWIRQKPVMPNLPTVATTGPDKGVIVTSQTPFSSPFSSPFTGVGVLVVGLLILLLICWFYDRQTITGILRVFRGLSARFYRMLQRYT